MFKCGNIELIREKIMEKLRPVIFEHIKNGPIPVSDNLFFGYNCIDGYPLLLNTNAPSNPHPFKGRVIIIDDQSVVVEEGTHYFSIIEKSLIDNIPAIGEMIEVIPYCRREFNGVRLGEGFKESIQFMDGTFVPKNCIRLDGITRIPGETIKNASLAFLISNLQTFKLSDGYRSITDLLVTAGAKNITVNDPTRSSDDLPPFIEFEVKTLKFEGKVKILYVYSSNSYSIILNGSRTLMASNVGIYKIASYLEEHIQDENWKKPQIKVLAKSN